MEKAESELLLPEVTERILSSKDILAESHFEEHTTYSSKEDERLIEWREKLINIYAGSISWTDQKTALALEEWGKSAALLPFELELSLESAVDVVHSYREPIGDIILAKAEECSIPLDVFYRLLSKLDSAVDKAVHCLAAAYTRNFTSTIVSAEYAMDELAIPLVRVTETIGILPLVGDLDTKRADQLMNRALYQGTSYHLDHIIIDLSGVPIIDTMVADQIFKVHSALRLLGIHTVLTGIRPEISQTMAGMGISFSHVLTFASLHQALKALQIHEHHTS